MAPWAVRKAQQVIKNVEKILAIETLIASQAISITEEELGQFKLGHGTQAVFERIRKEIPGTKKDEYMPDQINPCIKLIEERALLQAAENAIGKLS